MRRIFQLGTLLLLLSVFLAPVLEVFDRWDAPGLGNDTEMGVFCLVLLLCLLLAVLRLVRSFADRMAPTLVAMEWPERSPEYYVLRGFTAPVVLPRHTHPP